MTTTPSFTSLPIFCTTGNKVVYDSTIQNIGYQPQQQLPCEYYNYLENGETINLNTVQSGLTNIIAELTTLLTAASITASGNTVTNQTKAALDVLYQAHANGDNWVSALTTTLGDNWTTALSETLSQGHVPSSNAPLAIHYTWDEALVAILGNNWKSVFSNALFDFPSIGVGGGNNSSNSAFGSRTLSKNTSGYNNSAFGQDALSSNTSGQGNCAFGQGALSSNTTANANNAFGGGALHKSASNSCYANNAFGTAALGNLTDGNTNNAFGGSALFALTSGNSNSAFGSYALSGNTSFSNSTGIGSASQVTGSNQVQLGDSATSTYVYGTVQNRSDKRDKTDIRDTQLGLSFINALHPVDFKWNYRENYKEIRIEDDKSVTIINHENDGSKKGARYHHGLIAQEVKEVLDKQGIDFGGYQDHSIKGGKDVLSIGYDEFIGPMIKCIQELDARVKQLEESAKQ